MSLFDFNVALGRAPNPAGGAFETPEQLLAEMRRLRIDEALVYHNLAAYADVQFGNRVLLEQLDGQPGLYPCWVMAPSAWGDLPDPAAWVRDALEAGVRAVRLCPYHSLYSVADWSVGPLFAELERAELPVLLDFGLHHWSDRRIPWTDVRAVCERYPRLAVVVLDATVGDARDLAALLPKAPNLHIEYHAFGLPDGLELFARAGLAQRLIFGTGMPLRAGECVVEQTLRSGLGAADQEAVCSGNARRLLGMAEPDLMPRLIVEPFSRTPGPVVDAHAHLGAWERTCTPVRSPEAIVSSMDRCGIHKMIVSSFAGILGETRLGNRETAAAVEKFPDRLYGYCTVNPNYPEEIEAELHYCFDKAMNFVGLKFHCQLHAAQIEDTRYERALAFANERGLPILVHGGGSDQWVQVAERYPNAPLIMAHACGWDGHDPAGRERYRPVRDVANLFVDVAGSAAYRGALRALVDLVGARRILFGSDFPMFDLAFEMGRVGLSDLTHAERLAIAGGNALRLFRTLGGKVELA